MSSDKDKFINQITEKFTIDVNITEENHCRVCDKIYRLLENEEHITNYICNSCKEKAKLNGYEKLIPPKFRKAVELSPQCLKLLTGNCSIFYGGFGTGKTWQAYALCRELYTKGNIKTFQIMTEIGLLNNIKAGFNDKTFESRVNEMKQIDYLVVDEMGKTNDSEFNRAQIFEILNYRYDWEKKTILICNCDDIEELHDIISPAILDRFRENIIHMNGQSKRYK